MYSFSDRLVTNPAGERSLAISDGRGRAVRSVQLAANGDEIVSLLNPHRARPDGSLPHGYESHRVLAFSLFARRSHEADNHRHEVGGDRSALLVGLNGYGDVLETTSSNALGHTTKQRTDGAGRTMQALDAENFATVFQYDANGNRLSVRDGN